MTPNLDLMVTIFFDVKYLEKATRYLQRHTARKSYNICRMVPFSMTWMTPDPHFKDTPLLDDEYLMQKRYEIDTRLLQNTNEKMM